MLACHFMQNEFYTEYVSGFYVSFEYFVLNSVIV